MPATLSNGSMVTMDHSTPAPATTPALAQRVLVLQGGGAHTLEVAVTVAPVGE